jgi:hypothetical protein
MPPRSSFLNSLLEKWRTQLDCGAVSKPISNNPDARDIRIPALSMDSGIERLRKGEIPLK